MDFLSSMNLLPYLFTNMKLPSDASSSPPPTATPHALLAGLTHSGPHSKLDMCHRSPPAPRAILMPSPVLPGLPHGYMNSSTPGRLKFLNIPWLNSYPPLARTTPLLALRWISFPALSPFTPSTSLVSEFWMRALAAVSNKTLILRFSTRSERALNLTFPAPGGLN